MDYDVDYAKQYLTKKQVTQWKPSLETAQCCDDEGTGFCLACGSSETPAEPDARRYECDICGAHKVYGAAELALMGLVY